MCASIQSNIDVSVFSWNRRRSWTFLASYLKDGAMIPLLPRIPTCSYLPVVLPSWPGGTASSLSWIWAPRLALWWDWDIALELQVDINTADSEKKISYQLLVMFGHWFFFLLVQDDSTGEMIFDEVFHALSRCLAGLAQPFQVPGTDQLFRPKIFVTILAYSSIIGLASHQVCSLRETQNV